LSSRHKERGKYLTVGCRLSSLLSHAEDTDSPLLGEHTDYRPTELGTTRLPSKGCPTPTRRLIARRLAP